MEKKAADRVLTTRVTLLTDEEKDTGIKNKSEVKQKISDILKREPEKKRKVSKVLNREPKSRQKSEVLEREPEEQKIFEALEREPESRQESEALERELEDRQESEVLSKETKVKQTGKSLAAELIFSVFLIAAVCAFRTVLIYANNTDKLSFMDAARPMWIIMGISIAAFALLRLIFRRPHFACVFVAFGTFLYINLDWLVAFLRLFVNEYKPAAIGSLILYGLLLVGFFFFLRLLYKKKIRLYAVVNILAATFMFLVLFNVVTAFMAVGHAASKDDPEPTVTAAAVATPSPTPLQSAVPTSSAEAVSPVSGEFGLPNIYFFILDEFSSFDMLQKYYGYDAEPLSDYLVSAGFNISRESYGTDNQTEHALCDLMNLEYISRHLSKEECLDSIHNAELHKILAGLGYSEYQIANSTYFKGIDSLISGSSEEGDTTPSDKTDFGDVGIGDITGGLGGIIGDLLNDPTNTVVDEAALNKFGFYPSEYIRNSPEYNQYKNKSDDARSKLKRGDGLLEKFDYLQSANFTGLDTPRITYCYMLATHVPFVFNEYGGIIPHGQNRNWEDTSVYLNQYKFINKKLIAAVSSIIGSDPDSIIIIMSDHGIRYHAESNLKLKHTFYITNKDSCRIMNAVYVKGQKYDIEGLSSVNTLRYILSLYEGLNYPLIDDPVNSDSPDDLKGIIPRPR